MVLNLTNYVTGEVGVLLQMLVKYIIKEILILYHIVKILLRWQSLIHKCLIRTTHKISYSHGMLFGVRGMKKGYILVVMDHCNMDSVEAQYSNDHPFSNKFEFLWMYQRIPMISKEVCALTYSLPGGAT